MNLDDVIPTTFAVRTRRPIRARAGDWCGACADSGMRPVFVGCLDESGRAAAFEAVVECSCGTLERQRQAAREKREAEERGIPTRYRQLAKTLEEAADGFLESPGLARYVEIQVFWSERDRDQFLDARRRERAEAARIEQGDERQRQSA